jgi:predicted nucleic acid-binding protein
MRRRPSHWFTPSWDNLFARAETLSSQHTVSTLCRTLDTLHVALALELGAIEFCTFDQRQAAMARLAGLTVVS